jgi:hypothetical protein
MGNQKKSMLALRRMNYVAPALESIYQGYLPTWRSSDRQSVAGGAVCSCVTPKTADVPFDSDLLRHRSTVVFS